MTAYKTARTNYGLRVGDVGTYTYTYIGKAEEALWYEPAFAPLVSRHLQAQLREYFRIGRDIDSQVSQLRRLAFDARERAKNTTGAQASQFSSLAVQLDSMASGAEFEKYSLAVIVVIPLANVIQQMQ